MTALALAVLLSCPVAEAAGPWRGQVVDAETGQPLADVVVLMTWFRYFASVGGWAGGRFYAAQEAVTGSDGRFVIPAVSTFNWLPIISTIKPPELYIFKASYGRWRLRGEREWRDYERDARYEEAWRGFEGEGTVFELPRLKTSEERVSFLGSTAIPTTFLVPRRRMPRFLDAVNREEAALGLTPTGREGRAK